MGTPPAGRLAPSVPSNPTLHEVAPGMAPWVLNQGEVRLRRDGRVKVQDTVALGPRSDGIRPNLPDVFGDALY